MKRHSLNHLAGDIDTDTRGHAFLGQRTAQRGHIGGSGIDSWHGLWRTARVHCERKPVSLEILRKKVERALPCGVLDAGQILRLWQTHLLPHLFREVRVPVHEGMPDACITCALLII